MTIEDLAREIHRAHRAHYDRVGIGTPIIQEDWDHARIGSYDWYRDEQRAVARAVVLALAKDSDPTDEPRERCCRIMIQLDALVAEARGAS